MNKNKQNYSAPINKTVDEVADSMESALDYIEEKSTSNVDDHLGLRYSFVGWSKPTSSTGTIGQVQRHKTMYIDKDTVREIIRRLKIGAFSTEEIAEEMAHRVAIKAAGILHVDA